MVISQKPEFSVPKKGGKKLSLQTLVHFCTNTISYKSTRHIYFNACKNAFNTGSLE